MSSKVFSDMEPREDWGKYFNKNTGLIIDLGCGYGADSYFLAQKGYKVIAIDEENNIKFQHSNLTFVQQGIEKLIDNKFDGVITNFSLHFLDPEIRLLVIKHYLDNLKPGSIFYMLTLSVEKIITPAFLKLFPQEPNIEYHTEEDEHPPFGKHTHQIAKIVYKKPLFSYKKILILGDAGRGKTTFAEKLSKKISIPHYSTDDFYWKVKFTEANNKEESVKEISNIYKQDKWIMEGTTRRLIQEGLEKADIIYLLQFNRIIQQYYFLIKRKFRRKHESFMDLWRLLKHVTYKKYKKGYGNDTPPLDELIKPYREKIIKINSIKKINQCLESIN